MCEMMTSGSSYQKILMSIQNSKHLLTFLDSNNPKDLKSLSQHCLALKKAHKEGRYSKGYKRKQFPMPSKAKNPREEMNLIEAHVLNEKKNEDMVAGILEMAKKMNNEDVLHSSRKNKDTDLQELDQLQER